MKADGERLPHLHLSSLFGPAAPHDDGDPPDHDDDAVYIGPSLAPGGGSRPAPDDALLAVALPAFTAPCPLTPAPRRGASFSHAHAPPSVPLYLRTLSLLVPHDAPAGADPARYLASIDEIQRRTGLDFLSELDDASEKQVEAAKPGRVW